MLCSDCRLSCYLGCHLEKQLTEVVTFWKVIYTIGNINTNYAIYFTSKKKVH